MKEIKFRAWNKPERDMVYSKPMPDIGFWKYVAYDDTTPFMQYTGLKDKNGVEIYEGDIVQYEWGTKKEIVMDWGEDNESYQESYGWCGKERDGRISIIGTGPRIQEEIEVIGNIYENPELLK